MSRIDEATDVVALLTHRSIERPWILYEAGVAKGKLGATVLGLAVGVSLSDVNTGPFGQFQNCADDQDSLTKLVVQLLKRNPDAAPREEAVRLQVANFISRKDEIYSSFKVPQKKKSESSDDENIAKLFEEIKVMLRDINQAPLITNVTYSQNNISNKITSGMIEDMLMGVIKFPNKEKYVLFMIIASLIKNDIPWLYEPIMELYRASVRGVHEEIELAHNQLMQVIKIVSRGPLEKYLYRINEPGMFSVHKLMRVIEMVVMDYEKQYNANIVRRKNTSVDRLKFS